MRARSTITGSPANAGPDAELWRQAEVDFGGVRQQVSLACLPEARVGDRVLVHELTHVVQQNCGVVQRQVEQNSTSINTNSAFTQSLQRKFDPSVIAMLEKHIGSKASQQKIVAGKKHGQGMAEELARGGDGKNKNVNNFTAGGGQAAPEVIT
jgi:hypothetical protein